jgi:predicted nucleic acid-binding protein
MTAEYFVDTGGFYALIDRKDPDHRLSSSFFSSVSAHQLVTTNYIFDEVITLTRAHLGHRIAAKLGHEMKSKRAGHLIFVDQKIEENAWKLFLDRADKPYSFTDCVSFAFCRARGIAKALSVDRHFVQEGFLLWKDDSG